MKTNKYFINEIVAINKIEKLLKDKVVTNIAKPSYLSGFLHFIINFLIFVKIRIKGLIKYPLIETEKGIGIILKLGFIAFIIFIILHSILFGSLFTVLGFLTVCFISFFAITIMLGSHPRNHDYYDEDRDEYLNYKLKKGYGIGENLTILPILINDKSYFFKEKININIILKQVEFIQSILIGLNNIEGKIDKKSIWKIERLLVSCLDYNDLLQLFQLIDSTTLKESKVLKYYNNLLDNYKEVEDDIKEIKKLDIYKYNFSSIATKLKEDIDNTYNTITKELTKIPKLLKQTKSTKVINEIKGHESFLLKLQTNLESIRSNYSDMSILIDGLESMNKIKDELSYIPEIQKQLEIIQKAANTIDLLKQI